MSSYWKKCLSENYQTKASSALNNLCTKWWHSLPPWSLHSLGFCQPYQKNRLWNLNPINVNRNLETEIPLTALEEKHACLLTMILQIILLKMCFVFTMTIFLFKGVLFSSTCCGALDKQPAGQLGMCFSPLTSANTFVCSFALTLRDSKLALN